MSVTMGELQKCGQRLLDAAIEYNELANKAGVHGAIIWLAGTNNELVIVTKGEYHDRLLHNIQVTGPTRHFGYSLEEA